MSTGGELPVDPKGIKKMKKDIAKEAKTDQKDYLHALKELRCTERSEEKASKGASQANQHLKKMEVKAHDTFKSLQNATDVHDKAVTYLHSAQSEVQIQTEQAQKLRRTADTLRSRADELFEAKQVREEERSRKWARLSTE